MIRKWNSLLLLIVVTLLLCGCSMYSVTDLYCLPMRSDEYTNLQTVIGKAMVGLYYSAPLTGDNQQTVQAVDLDGDGESEYILFAKGSSDKALQILVFAGDGEKYELIDTIESAGSDFDQVEYIRMDGRPGYEIVVGRQVSEQMLRSVSVYSLVDGKMEQLISEDYSEFVCSDLDDNDRSEILILRPGESTAGTALLYSMQGYSEVQCMSAPMAEPAENILRLVTGKLSDGVKAIYVASAGTDGQGICTDVYALVDGVLVNVAYSEETGSQSRRERDVYTDDIDGDGVQEIPQLLTINTAQANAASEQYLIRWFALDSGGNQVDKLYTFHNYTGGWYLEVDAALVPEISVTQKGSSYEFHLGTQEPQKLLTVYVLTGQKREEQSVIENRFVLLRGENIIFAANLEAVSATYSMTKESLIQSFHLIQEDWRTGETWKRERYEKGIDSGR